MLGFYSTTNKKPPKSESAGVEHSKKNKDQKDGAFKKSTDYLIQILI